MDPLDLFVLQTVARGALMLDDQIADRVLRSDYRAILVERRSLAASLKRLQLRGYLEQRPVVYAAARARAGDASDVVLRVGSKVFDNAYYVTQRAGAELNMALPGNIRESFVEHHLKTLDAALLVEREVEGAGGGVTGFKLESELVRERSAGRLFDHSGIDLGAFPDALVTVRHADGREEAINIEYVSAKYTDRMIREKHERFAGRTIWAASNPETAARVERITGSAARLV